MSKNGKPGIQLTPVFKKILVGLGIVSVLAVVGWYSPGLREQASETLQELTINNDEIDNVTTSDKLELPSETPSLVVKDKPVVRMAGYAWNGETPITLANGGPFTTKGSLMERNGVNLRLVRQDWLSELKTMQLKFIEEYDKGVEFPESDKSAFAIMIMGDGAPFYISTMQDKLDKTFGKDKYHVQVFGAFGMSNGEDKLIGPKEWKFNPKSMLGALISTVPGDGDWVTTLNFCAANNLPVNPSFNTYDPNAVNIYPSADDDYINSAKELIASQTAGFTVELDEVINGKLTGKKVNKTIDGCATWTPGDKQVFDVLGSKGYTDIASTADFPNQMATTIIGVKEWAMTHSDIVSNILKSAFTASNQIKQYDDWARHGAVTTQKTFDIETADYWYTMFKGTKATQNGNTYNMGGTRVLTYADAMQYYGITDGTNRYKSVYNQVSNYLTTLNPFGFNESVERVVPYSEAVNLFFLKNINDIEVGVVETEDYFAEKTDILAKGEWHINFSTGSANIEPTSKDDLNSLYNLLVQAEQTKISLVGYTDNTGSNKINKPLSKNRANSVAQWLINKGISSARIQLVDGKGSMDPISSNKTSVGRRDNRRVDITLFK